ncbi:MAG: transcriptional repressor [Deltaproteobacteria bacterium]|nr:transcriptional repressor [Deltaproteobacteria bacterium]
MTPQRLSILRTVLNRLDHPTAEEVYKQARQRMPTVSLTTVYHTLEMLVEVGAFVRVSPYSDMRRYDKKVDEHVHVICSKCGQIVDVPPPVFPVDLPDIQQSTGFIALKPIHAFAGVCPKCQLAYRSS